MTDGQDYLIVIDREEKKSTMFIFNALAMLFSVETEGLDLPLSTWEMEGSPRNKHLQDL